MPTKLFITHRANTYSFPLGEKEIGIHKPGRYTGFDVLQSASGLSIIIAHSPKVRKSTMNNNLAEAFGALLFPTGQIAHVDDPITLTVESNSGNGSVRYDLVIAENVYQEVQGGTPITYSIIQGQNGSPTPPALPNPATQVILGTIAIAANGYQYSDLTYTPSRPGLPGDLTYEVLATIINQAVIVPDASVTVSGKTRYATNSEVIEQVIGNAAVTPASLSQLQSTDIVLGMVRRALAANVTGTTTQQNNNELYITPYLLKLKGDTLITQVNQMIENALPTLATTTVPGIARIADPQEFATRTSMSTIITPGHIGQLDATANKTGLVKKAMINTNSTSPLTKVTPIDGALTMQTLNHLGLGAMTLTQGVVLMSNPSNPSSAANTNSNGYNISPPSGYTTDDLVMMSLMPYTMNLPAGECEYYLNYVILNDYTLQIKAGVNGGGGFIASQQVKYQALWMKKTSSN